MAYFTDDSLLPENMAPLMITAAPYGPMWMPRMARRDIFPSPGTSKFKPPSTATTPARRCCTSTCATRRPGTSRRTSKNTANRSLVCARPCRNDLANRRIDLVRAGTWEVGAFGSYDQRHKLTTIDPKPDQITVSCGTSLYDLTALHPMDAVRGDAPLQRRRDARHFQHGGRCDARFLCRRDQLCVEHGIQPYFALPTCTGSSSSSAWFAAASTWDR